MKTSFRLTLPPLAAHFRSRHTSAAARAAHRRGNAAGVHGGRAKYGTRERRLLRREERMACLGDSDSE